MQNGKIKIIKRQQIEAANNSQTMSAVTSNGKPNISDIRRSWLLETQQTIQAKRQRDLQAFYGLQTA